ncbi:MAG: heavy metal transporter [Sedimentibacter sp.]|uniref:heavy metal transporter n=1 Tax=Sedimentibacter sp. TaxID=1960295 RepID=UPI0031580437
MNKVHYNVTRLQNTEMKTQVKNALSGLPGIKMINIDIGRGSIEVGFGDKTDEYSIRQCIEQTGCKIE